MVLPWLAVDYGTIQISLDRLISQQLHSRRAFRRLFFCNTHGAQSTPSFVWRCHAPLRG